MSNRAMLQQPAAHVRSGHRERVLAGLPVSERRLRPGGVSTAVLEGGEGPPLILLHGPGEFAGKWFRVIPALTATHRVIAPDLPAHGASDGFGDEPTVDRVLGWLDELIERTCTTAPVLVGHVLGGAIALRYAGARGHRIERLVLVDTLGLARFRPTLRFALAMARFLARPHQGTYDGFMRQCSADFDRLRQEMGDRWASYSAYQLELARAPSTRQAGRLLRELGLRRVPAEEIARIGVPTGLIWGRLDRANRLRVAEAASARYGWPLHVIEHCADDPPRDEPDAFVAALRALLHDAPARAE